MLPDRLKAAFSRYFDYEHLNREEVEYRTLALTIVVLITVLDFVYNLAYYLFGQPFTWWTTALYLVFTAVNLFFFKKWRHFKAFRNIQLVLTIALPLAAQVTHGGFTGSSGVVLAAFLAPLGAMMFAGLKTARLTFFFYLFTLLLAGIWEYFAQPNTNNLPPEVHLLFFEFNFAFIAAVAYFLMEGFLKNKASLLALVREEHQKADALLLNIFPDETAAELKRDGAVKAKSYPSATVMFTDFVGFSGFARTLSAEDLVQEIDFYFRAFDEIVLRYGLEKIKTIGDSYMCAGGIPSYTHRHAHNMVRAALEIRQFVVQHRDQQLERLAYPFDIRIGLHTGPVVAGVVGSSKMAYDIWGETVNIASRIEQACEADKINISEATYALIAGEFDCSYRGRFPAKHVGEISMYYVHQAYPAHGPTVAPYSR
jgi:class 3 adenylate cyclase